MKTPHKHAEIIKAWADGAEIQVRGELVGDDWVEIPDPIWNECCQYRIKPEPKPDEVFYLGRELSGAWFQTTHPSARSLIKVTFDGETGELKSAEV